jgi:Protein of unknown function (DUF3014)
MIKHIKWLVPVVILAGAAAVWYLASRQEPVTPAPDIAESSVPPTTEPLIRHPVSGQDDQAPLSGEDGSDESIKSSLEQLLQSADFAKILIPTQIINHIVATVDNLPSNRLAVTLRPLHATPGKFAVTGTEDDRILSPDNYSRYAAVLHVIRLADVDAIASWYRRHYVLFQEAYQNLGYPEAYFNDRLVEAIDDLLDTPELTEPVHLTQPKVFYEFADPALEARSAGQKTLLRMGPDNIRTIKAKLREFRTSIVQPSA